MISACLDFKEIIDKSFITDGELSKTAIEKMFDSESTTWNVINILIDLGYKVFIDGPNQKPRVKQSVYLRYYLNKNDFGQMMVDSVIARRKT